MAQDTKYGIIFNSGIGGIWIGIYVNNTICKFRRDDDRLLNYSTLPDTTFQLVLIDAHDNIHDISAFSIDKPPSFVHNEILEQPAVTVLEKLRFPSEESDTVFRDFLAKSIR